MSALSLDVVAVTTPKLQKAFDEFPYALYAKDPIWRAPLRFERKQQFSIKTNPALKTIKSQPFLAIEQGQVVGRIVAFVNSAHQSHHNDKTGHFGYYDFVQNNDAGSALLKTAKDWLRDQGCDRVTGRI